MITHTKPLVTVGIPVYNGAAYIGTTIESLLAQTWSDLELLISDNASSDETVAICEDYAMRDPRIRVIRRAANIGAARNWNSLVHEARGEFFKWASASDRCAPQMLELCIAALRSDPCLALCYGRTQLTDAAGVPIALYDGDRDIQSPRPSDRYRQAYQELRLNNAMAGVMRTGILRRTSLDRPYPSGDMVLTCEIALHGGIKLLPEVLLFRRQSAGTFTSMRTPLEIQRLYDPQAKRPLRLLRLRRHVDHFVSITRAPIVLPERLRAYAFAARMMAWDRVGLLGEFRALLTPPTPQ